MYSTSWRWPIFTKAHSTDIDYDNSMTGHSYGNRNFDQIFSANEAQDNENEKDLDICFAEHIDENFTEEISSTNNVHKAKQWLRLPYFGDQTQYFKWEIYWLWPLFENPFGRNSWRKYEIHTLRQKENVFFVIDSDITSKKRTFVDYCGVNKPIKKSLFG